MKSGNNIVAQALPGRNHIFKLLSACGLKIGDNKATCCNDAHYRYQDIDKGSKNGARAVGSTYAKSTRI
jgi:hypothetical protein